MDAGNPFPTKIYRPRPTRRMSVTRRLEKLHRMRATLEPQRSWMAGIARKIESYNLAYRLAWEHISEHQRREHPDIAQRLHDSIRRQVSEGATEAVFIASEALRDIDKGVPRTGVS
jgi:hypothetical protein